LIGSYEHLDSALSNKKVGGFNKIMAKKKDEIVTEQTDEGTTQEATHETTPETTPETIEDTEEVRLSSKEHQDLIKQANAAKELGRTLKTALGAHTTLKNQYDAQVKRLTELEESLKTQRLKERERELRAVEGTPDLIDSIRLKHQAEDEWEKVNKARSDYEAERSQYQQELDEAAKLRAEKKADELAKTSGLTADLLLQIGSDTTDNGKITYNLKRMEAIAKSVPKGEEDEEEEGAEEEGKEPAVRGQRSRAAGTGGRTASRGLRTWEDYQEAFIHEDISVEQYREAAKRFNVNI